MRDKRGQYQTITPAIGTSVDTTLARMNASSAADSKRGRGMRFQEISKAEDRLRVIEQISKYREEKIKREFLKLENDLRLEEEKQQSEI